MTAVEQLRTARQFAYHDAQHASRCGWSEERWRADAAGSWWWELLAAHERAALVSMIWRNDR